ncbi:MAG: pilus assembly protein [Gammaproteobacteria bacterium]|nr:pilus assembly protein [Gammaproteobacteria bacterium]
MNPSGPRTQQGAVLIVSLIILLVMTLIGLSAMRSTTLEERMAGNARNEESAFQAGEAALRDGEDMIQNFSPEPIPTADGTSDVWILDAPDPDTTNAIAWWNEPGRDKAWWDANGKAYSGSLTDLGSSPRYIAEAAEFIGDSLNVGQQLDGSGKNFYRITAYGTGGNDLARVLLQSTYARRY